MSATSESNPSAFDATSPLIETWGSTEVKVVKFNYTWIINNFSFCPQDCSEKLKSPTFSTGGHDKAEWFLGIYPMGLNEETKESIAIYLNLKSSKNPEVTGKFKFSILNGERNKTNVYSSTVLTFPKNSSSWGWIEYIKRDVLLDAAKNNLPDDRLTIVCELFLIDEVISTTGGNETLKVKIPDCQLNEDLCNLLNNEQFTDVTLVVRGKEYRAHRAVLSTRSRKFATMFENSTGEGDTIDIQGIEEWDTFLNMLTFIYTDRVPNINEKIAKELLPAAIWYELEGLKVICEETLCKSLTIENAMDILLLADLHSTDGLKYRTINFINDNVTDVMTTPSFASIFVSHPQLIAEVALERLLRMTKEGFLDDLLVNDLMKKTSNMYP